MSDANVTSHEDLGGWFSVELYTTDEVELCPGFLTNRNAHRVVFSTPTSVLDILPMGENITISEPRSKTKNGIVYKISADFDITVQTESIDDYMNKYMNKDFLLVATNHSGMRKIYGSKLFPLEFSYQPINGKRQEDGHGIRVSVFGDIPQKPVYIVTPVAEDGGGDGGLEME